MNYIDLGLPSGTLWADCNYGASKPEEYGDYYSFDEAQSLDIKVPTIKQWKELINKCAWTWTTQNGINGRLVTGSNGNSIFLPAAGYRYVDDLYHAGSLGHYWSSSLTGSPNYAWEVYFNSGNVGRYDGDDRYFRLSIRPVR